MFNFRIRNKIDAPYMIPVLIGALFSSCLQAGEITSPTKNSDWAKEEILMQISEMKAEIAELKKEVAQLKQTAPSAPAERKPIAGPSQVKISDAYPMGSNQAKVAIVEFTDFQCSFCARNYKTVFPEIKKNYVDKGKIQYIAQPFPLSIHSEAKGAAVAAHCAGDQKKYWDMHGALFTQKKFSREFYEQQAQAFGLKADQFTRCLDDSKITAMIEAKTKQAEAWGVSGTPKFFVGRYAEGKLTDISVISGAMPYTVFSNAIDQLL